MRKSIYLTAVLLLTAALLLTGCLNNSLPEIPADEIVSKSAGRMEAVDTFAFEILREGGPAYLDSAETLVLRRMTGHFVSPESAEADVRVILADTGVSVSIDIISIGDDQYETLPLAGTWQKLSSGDGFNPAELFDVNIGLKHILENDILEIEIREAEEIESLPGKDLYYLAGMLDSANLSAMTYGLIDTDPIAFKVWIDPDTFDLHQMKMVEHGGTDAERIWQINFWNFNEPYTITAPLP